MLFVPVLVIMYSISSEVRARTLHAQPRELDCGRESGRLCIHLAS